MIKNNCKVSVIIPTFNREDDLVNTIKCLLEQKFDEGYEIVVIDQTKKHDDKTLAFLEEAKDKIKYIFQDIPSVTFARNNGLRNAAGDVLIFVDDDITCGVDFIKNHYKAHMEGYDVVQGRVIEDGAEDDIEDKPLWLYPWVKYKGSNNCKNKARVNVITGCNFSITKDVVNKVGYFDERFRKLAVREDSDYGYRCYKAGLKMIFEPEALVFHHRRKTGGVDTGIENQYFNKFYYECEMLFVTKHFALPFRWLYIFRRYIYGKRQLYKLILSSYRKWS